MRARSGRVPFVAQGKVVVFDDPVSKRVASRSLIAVALSFRPLPDDLHGRRGLGGLAGKWARADDARALALAPVAETMRA